MRNETIEAVRQRIGGKDPVPAGVATAAIAASLALALLAKVLRIAHTPDLAEAARKESDLLLQLADDDVAAFNNRRGGGTELIEIPMQAARAAMRGLEVCERAVPRVHGLKAADVSAAALLLAGAVRAILACVEANVRAANDGAEFLAECREIEARLVN